MAKMSKKIIQIKKQICRGTIKEIIESFCQQFDRFKPHIFNIKNYLSDYKNCKSTIDSKAALIHNEISDSSNCKYF